MAPNAKEILAPLLEKYRREQREKEREQLNNLRELEIGQKVKKFKSPASKRAVSFLLESKNDWEDCLTEFKPLLGEDDKLDLNSLDEKKDKVESFLKFFNEFRKMKTRKEKKELESYEIANRSPFGWVTESCYNDNLFESSDNTKWYEKVEESPAKKQKRLREAEREATRLTGSSSSQLYDDDCDDDEDDDY